MPPEGEAKYKFPPKFKASHVVYNLYEVAPPGSAEVVIIEGHVISPGQPKEITIVEGFFDVMALYDEPRPRYRHVIALMGTNLSDEQERLIITAINEDTRLLIALDDDEAGQKCTADCLRRLGRHFWVKATTYEALTERLTS